MVIALLLAAAALGLAALRAGSGQEEADPADGGLAAVPQDADQAVPVALELLEGTEGTRRESELPLVEEGEKVLEGYRLRGDCIVAQAGYLDLSGKVWGCVVQGAGWVELSVVREGDEGGSEVVTWRMDAADVGL